MVLRLSWQGRCLAPGRRQALGAAELSELRRSAVRRMADQRAVAHPQVLSVRRQRREESSQVLPPEGLPQEERLSVRSLSAACRRAVPPALPVGACHLPVACPSDADRPTTALWWAQPGSRQVQPVLQAWLPRPVAVSVQQRAQPSAPVAAAERQQGAVAEVLRQARESALDAAVVPQPAVAARALDAAEVRPQAVAAEVSDVAAVPPRAAGVAALDAAAGLLPGEVAAALDAAVVLLPGAVAAVSDAAEEPQQAAAVAVVSGAAAVPPLVVRAEWAQSVVSQPAAARPSAAAWVFRRGRALPWPARRRSARSAHAMRMSQAASRSERSWQAARDEGLS